MHIFLHSFSNVVRSHLDSLHLKIHGLDQDETLYGYNLLWIWIMRTTFDSHWKVWVYVQYWPVFGCPAIQVYLKSLHWTYPEDYGTKVNLTLCCYSHLGVVRIYTFLLVTFDHYEGNSVMQSRRFQYLKNYICHQDKTCFAYKVCQMYVTYSSFVWQFSFQGKIIDGNDICTKLNIGAFFQKIFFWVSFNFVWILPLMYTRMCHFWWPLTFTQGDRMSKS